MTGVLEVQAHIDIFNPASGLAGFVLHGVVDLVIGTISSFFTGFPWLDRR